MLQHLPHIRKRRADLAGSIDVAGAFAAWEESCVPSYVHGNRLAALVSWQRLFGAAQLARTFAPGPRRILDFGASVGELGHLVDPAATYEFIEQDEKPAAFLQSRLPAAIRTGLAEAPDGGYDQVFAIDSLEHNTDYAALLAVLARKLAPGGILVLSGPTENWLYRLGRRVAGFDGHYHETTIHHIERAAAARLERRAVRTVPLLIPLFRLSVWSARAG